WSRERVRDSVARQVVEAHTRLLSQDEQIRTARDALSTAEETLRLTQARREFEVGAVLENILAAQDQTRARQDFAKTLGEYDKAPDALSRALGRFWPATGPATR